jgi:hypothetical protein
MPGKHQPHGDTVKNRRDGQGGLSGMWTRPKPLDIEPTNVRRTGEDQNERRSFGLVRALQYGLTLARQKRLQTELDAALRDTGMSARVFSAEEVVLRYFGDKVRNRLARVPSSKVESVRDAVLKGVSNRSRGATISKAPGVPRQIKAHPIDGIATLATPVRSSLISDDATAGMNAFNRAVAPYLPNHPRLSVERPQVVFAELTVQDGTDPIQLPPLDQAGLMLAEFSMSFSRLTAPYDE